MNTKSLDQYSSEQLSEAEKYISILPHYLKILSKDTLDPINLIRKKRLTYWLEAALASYFEPQNIVEINYNWSLKIESILLELCNLLEIDFSNCNIVLMGKLGCRELNLSSDIDLFFICNNKDITTNQKIKQFIQILNAKTEYGFISRIDTDIRPGGKYAELIQSFDQVEDYYFNYGETWEKMALIRARSLKHNQKLDDFLKFIRSKFSFRKHIDFGLFDDLSALRKQVQNEYSYKFKDHHIHLKLSPGGIRDIELFLHSLLIIHGGKNPNLYSYSTNEIISNLLNNKLLTEEESLFFHELYWQLRQLENLVQADKDLQTHELNENSPQFCNFNLNELKNNLNKSKLIIDDLIKPIDSLYNLPVSSESQKEWLKKLNYNDKSINEVWPEIINTTAQSLKKERDELLRQECLYRFIEQINLHSVDQNFALENLLGFIKNTKSKASFFRLLLSAPQLITDLSIIFGLSPYLSQQFIYRPELLDSFIYQAQREVPHDFEEVLNYLAEKKTLSLCLSAIKFLKDQNLENLLFEISSTANRITEQLLEQCKKQYGESSLVILKLGKWANNELGLKSDLDFIFITTESPNEIDFKVAKRFLSRIMETQAAGKIYEVDLRLRPSGSAGPIIISKEKLKEFLLSPLDIWEKLAYSRMIKFDFNNMNSDDIKIQWNVNEQDKLQLKNILQESFLKASNFAIDLKYTKGGLFHIELICQLYSIIHFSKEQWSINSCYLQLMELSIFDSQFKELAETYYFLRSLEQLNSLMGSNKSFLIHENSESLQRIAQSLKTDEALLISKTKKIMETSAIILSKMLS